MPSLLDNTTQIPVTFPDGATFNVWVEDTGESQGRARIREVFSNNWTEAKGEWNFLCAWKDRIGIALSLLGGSLIVGGKPVYSLPVAYPDVSAWAAKRVTATGVGLTTQSSSFLNKPDYARMSCLFSIPDYGTAASGQMAGELELDFAQNAVTVPQTQPTFKWADGTGPIEALQMPNFFITTIFASLTLYNRGTLNQVLLASLAGGCNSGTFQGYAAETVAFRGAKSARKVTTGGVLNFDLSLAFEICAGGTGGQRTWNQLFRPNAGWKDFVINGTGSKLYTPVDFTPLLA